MENQALLERLKNIRRLLGLTQKEFGERMGMALTTWASIEQGRNALNERAKILLQHIYNVNPQYLEHGTRPAFLDPEVVAYNSMKASPRPKDEPFLEEDKDYNFPGQNVCNKGSKGEFNAFRIAMEYADQAEKMKSQKEVFRFPCPSCQEKEEEIRALRSNIHRLEKETEHQRRIIEFLMESGRPQDRNLNEPKP
ncbi:MAG: helix-turn-helix transcriptional regulator [Bacteroidales bacterium]|nr:helix-turn-helix transcriptional regulator [Bacteroidales bacterium]NLM92772.1 helix-turn-helix domain-containing protein [Bacteroidales bacterium]